MARLNKKELLILGSALFVYFFYMWTKSMILNYPTFLLIGLFLTIIISIFLFTGKKFIDVFIKRDWIWIGIESIKSLLIAWLFTGFLLIPFNIYNIFTARKNNPETIKCDIKGLSVYSKNRSIFFDLDGGMNVIYGYQGQMQSIKNKNDFDNYIIVIKAKKGLLNSYVLEDWEISKRN